MHFRKDARRTLFALGLCQGVSAPKSSQMKASRFLLRFLVDPSVLCTSVTNPCALTHAPHDAVHSQRSIAGIHVPKNLSMWAAPTPRPVSFPPLKRPSHAPAVLRSLTAYRVSTGGRAARATPAQGPTRGESQFSRGSEHPKVERREGR